MASSITKKPILIHLLIPLFLVASVPAVFGHFRDNRTIQDKFNNLHPLQKVLLGIKVSSWVDAVSDNPNTPADESLPGYGFIVGCLSCAGAQYDAQGVLTNTADLSKIPTSWIMKMPENWNGKLIVVIPPAQGQFDQVTVFNLFAFLNSFLKEGYAISSMNHPIPGFAGGWTYENFIDSFSTKDLRNQYFVTGHLLNLLTDVFGRHVATYGYSQSRGTLLGMGLLAGEPGNPFDGFVMATGGNGYLEHLMTHIDAYLANPNSIALTHLTPLANETSAAQKVARLVPMLEAVDPDYRAFIFSGATPDEQLARALAYNLSDRPKSVQKSWKAWEHGADLKRPVIFIQGLKDRTVFPGASLTYAERVVDAGESDMMRLYLVKNMTHGNMLDPPVWPPSLSIDALHAMDDWVQNGTEPGALNVGAPLGNSRESCTTRGFESDPLACFCDEMGGVDFAGQAIPECS